ncbi:MAG: rhamnulokinase [Candidatus Sumerlaeota bacterium]|nr:rhamnulokinase [Candidatus Sumerlaeota bacterium]
MAEKRYLAIDLGAESGRGVVGTLGGGKLTLEEVHRFPNGPIRILDSMHWDFPRLMSEIKSAMGIAVRKCGPMKSLGVDTWGVDFGLVGAGGVLMGIPYHYRDPRTDGMMEAAFKLMPREEIFMNTGIQFMQLNSLFQLFSMVRTKSPLLKGAETLLFMPDLINYCLTGEKISEYSIATTSQMYDVRKNQWSKPLFKKLGLPMNIMPEVCPSGTKIGPLLKSVMEETGVGRMPVVAPACHDTGSAVAAVPAQGEDWAYLSSGTWSLIGVELPKPIVTPEVLKHAFTNEGGINGTARLLKNIMGLWLVQESRRQWAAEGKEYTYADLARLAEEASDCSLKIFVNPNHAPFGAFGQMPKKIQDFCRKTKQSIPQSHGAIVRCALESLALCYRTALESIEAITGRKIKVLHIVGGGSQNRLLNQFTANALGIPVVTGPVEATAAGNILVQAIADREIKSLAEARAIVRASFEVETYEPKDTARWAEALEKFRKLI